MRIINPYNGIDFGSCPRVNAISHEHIRYENEIKSAYDRGIRWFACVNYQPAAPSNPISGCTRTYLDCTAIDDTTIKEWSKSYNVPSFTDKDGNVINTDTLPQIANAEHPAFVEDLNKPVSERVFSEHFNVLGNLWSEAGWGEIPGLGWDSDPTLLEFRKANAFYDWSMIEQLFTADLQFNGKVFGTLNHNVSAVKMKQMIDLAPSVFKACEIFNQGGDSDRNQKYKNAYDTLLKQGYRLWCLAVVDWQGDIRVDPSIDFDRGCNVLLIPNYNSMNVQEKTEAGLDAYIAGRYYPSGLGNHTIQSIDINENNGVVNIVLDSSANLIKIITNLQTIETSGSRIIYTIKPKETYLRFEIYFSDSDFIFTNPIWIEDNTENNIAKNILLLDI